MRIPDVLPSDLCAATLFDPIDADLPDDEQVMVSRRAINRIAMVAAEVGGRFERERLDHDPMAWLLSPRALFGGRNALDACQERDHFLRAILVHGLSFGLDPDPGIIDELLSDEDDDDDWDWDDEPENWPDDEADDIAEDDGADRSVRDAFCSDDITNGFLGVPRLYTATICYVDNDMMLNAFHASITSNISEIAGYLESRYGPGAASQARIRQGYFAADPLVVSLVPDPIAEVICRMQDDEASDEFAKVVIDIEQRLAH